MDETPAPMSAEEAEALKKLLELNAAHATTHFTDLAAQWGLGGLHHQLDELLSNMTEDARPPVAVALAEALRSYLDQYGPRGVVGTSDTYRDHP